MITRKKEIITNQRSVNGKKNSPYRHQRKCIEKSMENLDANVKDFYTGQSTCTSSGFKPSLSGMGLKRHGGAG